MILNQSSLLFSAGFDAHKDDPLSNINLNSEDYFEITKRTLITTQNYCKVMLCQFWKEATI